MTYLRNNITFVKWCLSFIFSVTLVVLFLPTLLAYVFDDRDKSGDAGKDAWVQVDGDPKQTDLHPGDIVREGQRIDGECQTPDITIGISGDLRSMRVGPDPDTCDIVVKEIVARPID